ncbi:MAG: zf-HC2 domain-containing protein [Planctomycetota bacterium]|nr:zf-HC2 domain-containing protein [Planctomycetota bacterium]
MSDSLSLEQTAQFEGHLAGCPTCQAMLVEVAGGKETLDAAAAPSIRLCVATWL